MLPRLPLFPSRRISRTSPQRLAWAGCLVLAFGVVRLVGATPTAPQLEARVSVDSAGLSVEVPEDEAGYYILDRSEDLIMFSPAAVSLGDPSPRWTQLLQTDAPARYFRVRRVALVAPLDTDGDGIDDVWELERPSLLDPLDPSDANEDPDGNGYTHLDDYLKAHHRVARSDGEPQQEAISPELSIFNFGFASATEEALSPEVSVFNFGAASAGEEAVSPEVSVFNFGAPSSREEAVSPEISVFNLNEPTAIIEALSPEVSVENTP